MVRSKEQEQTQTDVEAAQVEQKQAPIQIVEREINLSLINEKLNYIISKLK